MSARNVTEQEFSILIRSAFFLNPPVNSHVISISKQKPFRSESTGIMVLGLFNGFLAHEWIILAFPFLSFPYGCYKKMNSSSF